MFLPRILALLLPSLIGVQGCLASTTIIPIASASTEEQVTTPTLIECLQRVSYTLQVEENDNTLIDSRTLLCALEVSVLSYVPSSVMRPTLQVGDRILVDLTAYADTAPSRGDVILFQPPRHVIEDIGHDDEVFFIMRVIGLPGETFEVDAETIYINGLPLSEPYVEEVAQYQFGPIQVLPNEYIVLGDKRESSNDSHLWGSLPSELIRGRVVSIACPAERQGTLQGYTALDTQQQAALNDFHSAITPICTSY